MEKELESCMGLLLRADLTGPAIKAHLPKRVGWPCSARSALKRTPMQDFISFSIMFYYIISTKSYTTIGTFGRAVVLKRLIDQALYHKILLLQNFNDIGGKVLKHFNFSLRHHGGC